MCTCATLAILLQFLMRLQWNLAIRQPFDVLNSSTIRPLNMPNNALLMYKIKQRRQGNHKYIRMKQVYKELKRFFFMSLGLSI